MTTPVQGVDHLSRILASNEDLAPSSGFASSVMERVREEAAAPELIAFPWRRVMPGAMIAALGLVWCVVQLVWIGIATMRAPILIGFEKTAFMTPRAESAGLVIGALALSLLSWLLARRLAGSHRFI